MSGPRNGKLYRQGLRHREQLRQLMIECAYANPFRVPSGKQLQALMRERHGQRLALSTVYWHVAHIKTAAYIETLEPS